MRGNIDLLAHLPMVFMGKQHPFFQHRTLFSQTSINTNKIELINPDLDLKNIKIAVELASKFLNKMQEHIDDNPIPKNVPAFAKSLFAKIPGGGFTHATKNDCSKKSKATAPMAPNSGGGGGKRKGAGEEQEEGSNRRKEPRKKTKMELLDKALKIGLFHLKKGTPLAKALPDKSTLKSGISVCLDFCSRKRKCNFPHALCKMGKHYTN